ncbi:MAG TPA: hypothetical protein HA264_02375 [Methanolinea sp.]|nr:hypothetical protein [Methanolinea sp.]
MKVKSLHREPLHYQPPARARGGTRMQQRGDERPAGYTVMKSGRAGLLALHRRTRTGGNATRATHSRGCM